MMKKIISILIVTLTLFSSNTWAAAQAIPQDKIPALPAGHKVLVQQDFEEKYNPDQWMGVTTVQDEAGNKIGSVPPNTIVQYGNNKIWLDDCTIMLNLKVDYVLGKWTEILDIGYRSETVKGKIMMVKNEGDQNGKLYFATVGQEKDLWLSKEISGEHPLFTGQWVKLTVEMNENNVKIYLDEELMLETGEYTLADSWLAFKTFAGGSTIYLDNLLITRQAVPDEIPTVEKDTSRYTVLWQDFENLQTGTMDELINLGYGEVDSQGGTTIFDFNGSVTTGFQDAGKGFDFLGNYLLADLKLEEEYTIEMNMKLDPTVEGEYGKSWPELRFNRYYAGAEYGYKLYFNTTSSSSLPSLVKYVGGKEEWPVRTQEQGTLDLVGCTGSWAYLKIEKTANEVALFWNDKETPCYTWKDSEPLFGGGIRINNAKASQMVIDNLYISTTEAPAQPISITGSLSCEYSSEADSSMVTAKIQITNSLDKMVEMDTAI